MNLYDKNENLYGSIFKGLSKIVWGKAVECFSHFLGLLKLKNYDPNYKF